MQRNVVLMTWRRATLSIVLMIALVGAIQYLRPASAFAGWKCVKSHTHRDRAGKIFVICDKREWVPQKTHPSGQNPIDQNPSGPSIHVKSPQEIYKDKVAAIRKKNADELARYREQIANRNTRYKNGDCVFKGDGQTGGPDCGNVTPPNLIQIPNPPKGAKPVAPPPIPPIDAAYIALSTKLSIAPSGVGIGPDPDLSRWKMAVVGHSYWLWANGPTHLGPVSASGAGYSVTLQATLTGTTFQMGDGGVVKCTGPGTPYPGDRKGLYTKSPTCGYTYATTSRHQAGGTYQVRMTTYWNVAYTTPIGSGTIPIVLASERELKVGELQTVITH